MLIVGMTTNQMIVHIYCSSGASSFRTKNELASIRGKLYDKERDFNRRKFYAQ